MNLRTLGITVTYVMFAGSAAFAQTPAMSEGQSQYQTACAMCHGNSGLGDGVLAPLMNVNVPDLTTISAKNDGEFPWLDMFHIVDGRTGVRGHGGPMPVWGEMFSPEADGSFGPYGAEVITRGRVAVLVDYLESIQE